MLDPGRVNTGPKASPSPNFRPGCGNRRGPPSCRRLRGAPNARYPPDGDTLPELSLREHAERTWWFPDAFATSRPQPCRRRGRQERGPHTSAPAPLSAKIYAIVNAFAPLWRTPVGPRSREKRWLSMLPSTKTRSYAIGLPIFFGKDRRLDRSLCPWLRRRSEASLWRSGIRSETDRTVSTKNTSA